MKKLGIFSTIVLLMMLLSGITVAKVDEWEIVDRSFTNDFDYSKKVGDYFFSFDEEYVKEEYTTVSYLCYSKNGKDFSKTEYKTKSLPIYSKGLYFLFDTTMNDVPENKRVYGFNNSPSYILDKEFKLINKIEHNGYAIYKGFYNGYHYFNCNDYNEIRFENVWTGEKRCIMYKTIDGKDIIKVNPEEDLSFMSGVLLTNNDYLVLEDGMTSVIKNKNGEYEVVFEKGGYISNYYENKSTPLFSMYYKENEEVVDWIYDRKTIESIEKKYLSLDGVYGIEMPKDIGGYNFTIDGIFYFDRDEKTYYCISKELLENKIKVIYKDKILAFEVPPTTENDRTLVPMRFLFEQMGAGVTWDDVTQSVTVTKDNYTVKFAIDNQIAFVNGVSKQMDVPARLISNKTMIPLRFLSEELGCTVEWDEETRTVYIND